MKNIVVAPGQIVSWLGFVAAGGAAAPNGAATGGKEKMGWSFLWSKKRVPGVKQAAEELGSVPLTGLVNQNQPVSRRTPGRHQGPGWRAGSRLWGATGWWAPSGRAGLWASRGPVYSALMPSPGGRPRRLAVDAAAIDAPLLATGDTGGKRRMAGSP